MSTLTRPSLAKARKGDKRERTRVALIEAAAALIREKGYDKVTLNDVAARAGMTSGAIYGNFRNRDDLFVAVAQSRWRPIVPTVQPGVSLKAYMRVLGKAVSEAARERRPNAVLAAAYRTYVLSHEDMRKKLAGENAARVKAMAAGMLKAFPQSELPMPADKFVLTIAALIDGLLFAHFQAPTQFTEDVIVAALEAMVP